MAQNFVFLQQCLDKLSFVWRNVYEYISQNRLSLKRGPNQTSNDEPKI